MRVLATITAVIGVLLAIGTPAHAGLHGKMAACAAIADNNARLACFDGLAATASDSSALNPEAAAALKKEFRFDSGLMTGPFTFRFSVSGDLKISRSTMAAREVERIVRRVSKALTESDNWGIAVIVHGAQMALSRGNPKPAWRAPVWPKSATRSPRAPTPRRDCGTTAAFAASTNILLSRLLRSAHR